MNKKIYLLISILLIFSLAACSRSLTEAAGSIMEETQETDTTSVIDTQTESEAPATIAETVNAEHVEVNEDPNDYTWDDANVITIDLNGNSISTESQSVLVDGSQATITTAGTYSLSGELSDGQIIVDTDDDGIVRLILDHVDIHNGSGPAIYIGTAEKAMIVLTDGSENELSDGSSYTLEADSDEPNATIFSTADLTIYGSGALNVEAIYNDGIASKDGLVIVNGTIDITSIDDGLRGKDYVVIKGGDIRIDAGGDGIKSDEAEDASKGFITIEAGLIRIKAVGDAIEAESDVTILDGTFDLTSGGGSSARTDESTSSKGIKGTTSVIISGGNFTINGADDGLHSNNNITVNGGSFQIASGDDGMHADATLTIDGGQINVTNSYEGLESAVISINDGEIQIISSDDGINLAGGADGSGTNLGMPTGGRSGRGGGPGQDMFAASGNYYLYINGGSVIIDAGGDGIDSNGSIEMTDGLLIINGPTENMNGALDYMGTFNISGGFLIAAGSAGMAQSPSNSSSQNAVLINFNSAMRAGTLVHVQSSSGETIFTFAPSKNFQSIDFSMPQLSEGTSYSILVGGTANGEENNGLYLDGTYTGGTEYTNFSITGVVTQIGTGGMMRR
jgi:hypothetical protein